MLPSRPSTPSIWVVDAVVRPADVQQAAVLVARREQEMRAAVAVGQPLDRLHMPAPVGGVAVFGVSLAPVPAELDHLLLAGGVATHVPLEVLGDPQVE